MKQLRDVETEVGICPFCRSGVPAGQPSPQPVLEWAGWRGYFVECLDCGATGPSVISAADCPRPEIVAVEMWNAASLAVIEHVIGEAE